MNKSLAKLYSWYANYVDSFKSNDPKVRINIEMKDQHTKRVCMNIIDIGMSLNLGEKDLQFAETAALLHDVGRFPQYACYGTFSDVRSEDHAELGASVIEEQGVLNNLDCAWRSSIVSIIRHHNKKKLPKNQTNSYLLFLKLLRDADKLDIYRITTEHYSNRCADRNKSLDIDLPDEPVVSQGVLDDILHEQVVDFKKVRILNDFKLLQMSWAYDLNFQRTKELVSQNKFIEIIYDSILNKKLVQAAYRRISNRLLK